MSFGAADHSWRSLALEQKIKAVGEQEISAGSEVKKKKLMGVQWDKGLGIWTGLGFGRRLNCQVSGGQY